MLILIRYYGKIKYTNWNNIWVYEGIGWILFNIIFKTGSFKERGARYTLMMLDEGQKKKGVIAASAGNHALALAYHGGLLGT